MVKICLSCKKSNNIFIKTDKFGKVYNNRDNITAEWAKKYGYKNNTPPEGYDKLRTKNIYNQKTGNLIKIKAGKKFANRYIYVWASLVMKDDLLIKDPRNAYYSSKRINDVFGKLDKNGEITIKIRNPQIYREKYTFPPHIHYKISNKSGTDYTIDFFTMTYLRKIKYEDINRIINQKHKRYILVNALSAEYFARYMIPTSVNLSYKDRLQEENVKSFFNDVLINYPDIKRKVKGKKLKLTDIPIVVYCAKPECQAAEILANKLLKNGFVNILYYKGGLKEYYKKVYNEKLF